MSTTWVRLGYSILLGLVLALTAGFGASIIVTEPRPAHSPGLSFGRLSGQTTDAENTRMQKSIDSYYDDVNTYKTKYPDYQRDIFVAFAGLGLLFAIVGVALPAVVNYLRVGFIIGGLFLLAGGAWFAVQAVPAGTTPASSILTLLAVGTPKVLDTAARFLRFAVTIVGLLLLLFVGLWRLTEWSAPAPAQRAAATPEPYVPGQPAAAAVVAPPAPPVAPADAAKWERPQDRIVADFQGSRMPAVEPAPGAGARSEGTSAPS